MKSSVTVLDFDGTVVQLPIDYNSIRKSLRDIFLEYKIDEKKFSNLYKTIRLLCNKIEKIQGIQEAKSVCKLALKTIEQFEIESIEKIKLKKDSYEFLKMLKKKGIKTALFSSNTRKCIEKSMDKTGLSDFFDYIVSANDVKELKPSPEGIFLISKHFNVPPKEIVMIGDSVNDVLAAKVAGAKPIGVAGGLSSKKELKDAGAFAVCDNLSECTELIE